MKRSAALALLLSVGIAACSARLDDISRAIGALTRAQGATELRLAEVTWFTWDKVYLFGPYEPRVKVCEQLAVPPGSCERVVPFESTDDGVMTLVFVHGTQVVHCARHGRGNGDFTPVPLQQPIPAGQAIFRVVPSGVASDGTVWLRLVLRDA